MTPHVAIYDPHTSTTPATRGSAKEAAGLLFARVVLVVVIAIPWWLGLLTIGHTW